MIVWLIVAGWLAVAAGIAIGYWLCGHMHEASPPEFRSPRAEQWDWPMPVVVDERVPPGVCVVEQPVTEEAVDRAYARAESVSSHPRNWPWPPEPIKPAKPTYRL